jgi:hypothetical protein
MSKEPNRFPAGWDKERTSRVIAHYEGQSEEDAVSEDERVLRDENQAVFKIPSELAPAVRKLLAKHRR